MIPAALSALAKGDLANFAIAATPGGIEMQEKMGQMDLVSNTDLPIKMVADVRAALEKYGVVLGPPVDDLFLSAQLPAGWKKVATDHSMWSKLVDDNGRTRAMIFYKAAFYDRDSFMRLSTRYSVDTYVTCDSSGNPAEYGSKSASHRQIVAKDADSVIKIFGMVPMNDYRAIEEVEDMARKWMDETYPNWKDATAYWD